MKNMKKPCSGPRGNEQRETDHTVFVPFAEDLLEDLVQSGSLSLDGSDRLVPFSLTYQCVRLLDGTYDFSPTVGDLTSADLPNTRNLVHAA